MQLQKCWLYGLAVVGVVGFSSAALPGAGRHYRNLKVLSKNISAEAMDDVMERFNSSLGVNCLFCHPGQKNGASFSVDYVTDSFRNKKIARDMLRMSFELNRKYFGVQLPRTGEKIGRIWCKTCHAGLPVPIDPQRFSSFIR